MGALFSGFHWYPGFSEIPEYNPGIIYLPGDIMPL
jgi:hypothetical protein